MRVDARPFPARYTRSNYWLSSLGRVGLAQDIPKTVLAGILIKVGTDIIDCDYLKRLKHAPVAGIIIMLTVLIITVTIELLLAVGIGMVMPGLLFMRRMTQMQIEGIKTITDLEKEKSQIACLPG